MNKNVFLFCFIIFSVVLAACNAPIGGSPSPTEKSSEVQESFAQELTFPSLQIPSEKEFIYCGDGYCPSPDHDVACLTDFACLKKPTRGTYQPFEKGPGPYWEIQCGLGKCFAGHFCVGENKKYCTAEAPRDDIPTVRTPTHGPSDNQGNYCPPEYAFKPDTNFCTAQPPGGLYPAYVFGPEGQTCDAQQNLKCFPGDHCISATECIRENIEVGEYPAVKTDIQGVTCGQNSKCFPGDACKEDGTCTTKINARLYHALKKILDSKADICAQDLQCWPGHFCSWSPQKAGGNEKVGCVAIPERGNYRSLTTKPFKGETCSDNPPRYCAQGHICVSGYGNCKIPEQGVDIPMKELAQIEMDFAVTFSIYKQKCVEKYQPERQAASQDKQKLSEVTKKEIECDELAQKVAFRSVIPIEKEDYCLTKGGITKEICEEALKKTVDEWKAEFNLMIQ